MDSGAIGENGCVYRVRFDPSQTEVRAPDLQEWLRGLD